MHFSYHDNVAISRVQKLVATVKMKNSTVLHDLYQQNLACNFFNMEHFAYTVNLDAYRNMKHVTYKKLFISRTFFISDYHSHISATKFISAVKMKNSTSYITYINKNLACIFLAWSILLIQLT